VAGLLAQGTETTLTEQACHAGCKGLEERTATVTWQTRA